MKKTLLSIGLTLFLIPAAFSGRVRHAVVIAKPIPQTKFFKVKHRLPNKYIVVLLDQIEDVTGTAQKLAAGYNGSVLVVYEHVLKGFTVSMSEKDALRLSQNQLVKLVQEDGLYRSVGTQVIDRSLTISNWGLDRIDQRLLPLNQTYRWNNTGQGVNVYPIDSGVMTSHPEFGGRAINAHDSVHAVMGNNDDFAQYPWVCNDHATRSNSSPATHKQYRSAPS